MRRSTRVTETGQATIPKPLREKYALEPGDEVVWVDTDGGIEIKKPAQGSCRGMLVPDDTSQETREAVAEELATRLRDCSDRNYEEK